MKKWILLILGIIFLISIVFLGYKGFLNLLFQKAYPKTAVQSTRFLVMSTEEKQYETSTYDSSKTNYNILKLISMEGSNFKEEKIDSFSSTNAFIHNAIIVDNTVYYTFQNYKDLQLIGFNLNSKNKSIIDNLPIESVVGNPDMEDEIFSQLFYSKKTASLVLYYDNKAKTYNLNNNTSQGSVLWEDINQNNPIAKVPIGFKLKPQDSTILTTSNFDHRERPIAVNLGDDGRLTLIFNEMYYQQPNSIKTYCYDQYKNINHDEIGKYTTLMRCDPNSDYKCSIECLSEKNIAILDKLQAGNVIRGGKLVKDNDSKFAYTYSEPLYRINCGGYFQIGPCFQYHIASLNMATESGKKELYKFGSNNLSGQFILRNLMFSSDGEYLAYSLRKTETDTYIIKTNQKNKPVLIAKNAYPLYFEIIK